MINGFRSKFVRTLSPSLSVAMLLWGGHLTRAWPSRSDAAAFRERSRDAVEAIPLRIGDWTGRPIEPQVAAIELGRPNVERSIEYSEFHAGEAANPRRPVWLNVVQCRRASDLLGHEPARYYAAAGETLTASRPRVWLIPGTSENTRSAVVAGTEHRFVSSLDGRPVVRIVYNFMVAPGRGLVRDVKELEEAAEDRQRRYFGAAQFQVVFASLEGEERGERERDETFVSLVRASWPAIEALRSGE